MNATREVGMSRFFKAAVVSITVLSFGLLNTVPQTAGVYGCKIKLEFKVGDKQYLANGAAQNPMATAPEMKWGRLFLPAKNVTMHIGATLSWQNAPKTLTVTLPYGKTVELAAGKNKYKVDSDELSLDASNADVICYILNGSFMAPAKILAEAFSATETNWDVGKRRFTLVFEDYDCNASADAPRPPEGTSQPSDYDWACLRGNQAHTGEIPVGSGPRGPNLKTLWQAQAGNEEVPPIIVGNRVYTAGTPTSFLCMDVETGKTLWQANLGTVSSATYHEGSVYVGYWGNVACLDAGNGETIWTKQLQTSSNCASPAIVDGRLYVPCGLENGSIVYCLDIKDGKTIWETRLSYPTFTDILVVKDKVFQVTLDGKLYYLDAKTGAPIWIANLDASPRKAPMYLNGKVFVQTGKSLVCLDETSGAKVWGFAGESSLPCAFGYSVLFCSGGKLHKYSFENAPKKDWEISINDSGMTICEGKKVYVIGSTKVSCFSAEDGSTNWSAEFKNIGLPSSPFKPMETAIAKGKMFFVYKLYRFFCVGDATAQPINTDWACLRGNQAHTGEIPAGSGPRGPYLKTKWSVNSSNLESPPIIVGDKVFASLSSWSLWCLDIQTGKKIWEAKIGTDYSPLYFDGKAYIAYRGNINCLDADNGKMIWHKEIKGTSTSSPAAYDGFIYVTIDNYGKGSVLCLNPKDGSVVWEGTLSYSASTQITVYAGKVFQGTLDKRFHCLDAKTGKSIWTVVLPEIPTRETMYMDGAVFARTNNSLICLDAKDGRKIWKSDYRTSTPCMGKGAFYFWSKGFLHKFSLAKNVVTKAWEKKVDTIFHIFLEGDKVYAVGSAKLFCFSGKDGSYIWSTTLADAGVPSSNLQVVIAKGLLFFSNPFWFARTFYCVGDATAMSTDCNWPTSNGNPWHTGVVGNGCGPKSANIELLWKSWSGDQATMPVIVGNKVFTVSSTGKMLQCLDIGTGKPIWTKQIEAYASICLFRWPFICKRH